MTQNEMVLNHLRSHDGISSMQAFRLYGITRLSARISDLRAQGHKIEMEYKKNRKSGTHYGVYRLEGN